MCPNVRDHSKDWVFLMFVSPGDRKVGALKRRVRSHLARWVVKKCRQNVRRYMKIRKIECQGDSSKNNIMGSVNCYVSFFCMLRILGDCAANSNLPQPGPPSIVQIPSSLWLQMVVKLSLTSPSWILFKASEAAMCSNDTVGVSCSDGQPREFAL